MKRASQFKLDAERVLEAENLTMPEIRFTVANYYAAQEMRKRIDMQLRHQGDKPLLSYTGDSFAVIEVQVCRVLERAASAHVAGRWLLSQHGIGPVISSGMLAHIDMEWEECTECLKKKSFGCECGKPFKTVVCETAGRVWRFAGLDPTSKWNKGERRPWNAQLKQICWHAGECFKRTSGSDKSFYGDIYRKRKEYEVQRNDTGGNAERAKTYKVSGDATEKTKKALASGKLPDGQLDRQATRYAVKMLLSHLHLVMFWDKYRKVSAKPFALSILGHAHEIVPPNLDLVPGLADALREQGIMKAA